MVSGLFLCSGHVLRRVRASSFGGGDALGLSKKWPVLPWVRSRILDRSDRRSGSLAKVSELGDRQNASQSSLFTRPVRSFKWG